MFLVLGVGRSGTSEVARILREQGVNMGDELIPPDESNPSGYYEDIEFCKLNSRLLRKELSLFTFRERLAKIIKRKTEPWGLKDPYISTRTLLKEYLALKPHVIYCIRPREDIITSYENSHHPEKENAAHIHDQRKEAIEEALLEYPHLTIDCYQEDKEEVIKGWYNEISSTSGKTYANKKSKGRI